MRSRALNLLWCFLKHAIDPGCQPITKLQWLTIHTQTQDNTHTHLASLQWLTDLTWEQTDYKYKCLINNRPDSSTFLGFRCDGGKLPPSGIIPPSIGLLSLLHRKQQDRAPGHSSHPPRAKQRTKFTFPFSILFKAKVRAREQKKKEEATIHWFARCSVSAVRTVSESLPQVR